MSEEAFWIFDSLLNEVIPGCFAADCKATYTMIEDTKNILKRNSPKLMRCFEHHDYGLEVFAFSWFRCMFVTVLPNPLLLRVWDCMLYKGDDVLVMMAVCYIQFYKQEILACDTDGFIEFMRSLGKADGINCDIL